MSILFKWSTDWCIPHAAVADLMNRMGSGYSSPQTSDLDYSESAVQARVRLEAAQKNIILWRNNVGAIKTDKGMIRYGLCNDSKKVNDQIKSADLIGIRPVQITHAHVGFILGQFVSRECKNSTWKYTGDEHELAQEKWAQIINGLGGDARFCNGEGSFE